MGELMTAASSVADGQLIDEQVKSVVFQLVEGTGDQKGRVFARGEFASSAKPTANKRLYGRQIWESNIKRLSEKLKRRRVLGELDHPTDGRTALQRVSHVITDLRMEGDQVIGETEILNTSRGRDLKAIMEAGVPVGVSSRGFGATVEKDGVQVVEDGYELVTFDFVAEPADDTAYPDVYFEGVGFLEPAPSGDDETGDAVVEDVPSLEDDSTQAPSLPNEEALRLEFEQTIVARLESMRGEVERDVRAQLEADPTVAGARSVLEQVGTMLRPYLLPDDVKTYVGELENEIKSLKTQLAEAEEKRQQNEALISELATAARKAGYKYHLESLIAGDSDADVLRRHVGDVMQFSTADELEDRLDQVREQLRRRKYQEAKLRREQNPGDGAATQKVVRLTEELQGVKQMAKRMALQIHAYKRLQNHPNSATLLKVLEHANCETTEAIDKVIDAHREPRRSADQIEEVRGRVSRILGGGYQHLQEDAPAPRDGSSQNRGKFFGSSQHEFRKLAGMGGKS